LLRSETRLEALEAIYSAVVRSIASGIITLGEDGRSPYLNPPPSTDRLPDRVAVDGR